MGYKCLFGVVASADSSDADLIGYGQPVILYTNGKLAIWFRLKDHYQGRPYGAGDTLGLWTFPYGGSVEVDVNKWHHLAVSSVKENGIV